LFLLDQQSTLFPAYETALNGVIQSRPPLS
jgi:hypothetical protein